MSVRVISFDAAHTLMDVRWHPGRFAVDSARAFGLATDESMIDAYDRLLRSRWGHYVELNAKRDRTSCDQFWDMLTADWLLDCGLDDRNAADLGEFARKRMFTEEAGCFSVYPETKQALTHLKAQGYRLIVVSNWDYSLERTLAALGLRDHFSHVFASLELGAEKPERRLFQLVEHQAHADAEILMHVGDNPVDDYQGARDAGWRAVLVDRSITTVERPRIPSLLHVEEAVAWSG